MQVGKWGNSLAIRLPAVVVELMGLKEGDEVDIQVASDRALTVAEQEFRKRAVAKLAAMGWTLPPGFKFSRDEANERGNLP